MGGKSSKNVLFYRNEYAPQPLDLTLGEICEFWQGDYERLNTNEYYIHWLFPTRDCGRNSYASQITDKEIEIIKNDEVLLHRFMTSFDMMLDFFGMRRKGNQFELSTNFHERLQFLKVHKKNFMKITRILICLRLLGLDDLWENWLQFLLQLIHDGLLAEAQASYTQFWIKT